MKFANMKEFQNWYLASRRGRERMRFISENEVSLDDMAPDDPNTPQECSGMLIQYGEEPGSPEQPHGQRASVYLKYHNTLYEFVIGSEHPWDEHLTIAIDADHNRISSLCSNKAEAFPSLYWQAQCEWEGRHRVVLVPEQHKAQP